MNRGSSFLSVVLLLAAATQARADLPKGFDWSDESVWALARTQPSAFQSASPEERQKLIGILLMCPDQSAGFGSEKKPGDLLVRGDAALNVLSQASDLDRFKTLRLLDASNDLNVRQIYGTLDKGGQEKLLALAKSAGDAGTAAGLQQLGIISDNDDTAFPTQFKPDGPIAYKGSADFYKLLAKGTDGAADANANTHYVSARVPLLGLNSKVRLAAAGLPSGTFDFDDSLGDVVSGLDGIQDSKEKNIDLWMKLHPGQRFVLLGDSLQRDPEVYRWALEKHPDQVQLVLIHRAGGPDRDPAAFQGEVFFDDYPQAKEIVTNLGIPQPGAKLPAATDPKTLPAPRSLVSDVKADKFPKTVVDFVEETGASFGDVAIVNPLKKLGHVLGKVFGGGEKKSTAAPPAPIEQRTGMTQVLDGAQQTADGEQKKP